MFADLLHKWPSLNTMQTTGEVQLIQDHDRVFSACRHVSCCMIMRVRDCVCACARVCVCACVCACALAHARLCFHLLTIVHPTGHARQKISRQGLPLTAQSDLRPVCNGTRIVGMIASRNKSALSLPGVHEDEVKNNAYVS